MEQSAGVYGSMGPDITKRYVNPFDVEWESRIRWDHEFTGKAALAEMANAPRRTVVTLEWNADDLAEVYSSQFRGMDVEPVDYIEDRPNDVRWDPGTVDPATGYPKMFSYYADRASRAASRSDSRRAARSASRTGG